jgi:HAD superfamily hydrolase (TIGR01484 family)
MRQGARAGTHALARVCLPLAFACAVIRAAVLPSQSRTPMPGLRSGRLPSLALFNENIGAGLPELGRGIEEGLPDLTTGALRLRGGATSGIWETFNRMQAEGPHHLNETTPQDFNEAQIGLRRSNELFRFAVRCDARPFRGERVDVTGVWSPPEGDTTPSKEFTEELEIDPKPGSQDLRRGLSTWRGQVQLPPGHLTYKFCIRRAGEQEVESITRSARIFNKPPQKGVMVATDLDGTMLGNPGQIDAFFKVWHTEYKANGSMLVYNTGRPLDSALGLIHSGQLPQPDALICSEGTQIFWFPDQDTAAGGARRAVSVTPDEEWRHALNTTWDWPQLKAAVNATLAPHRKHIIKFLPLADMEIQQPMIVIALDSQGSSSAVLDGLKALPAATRNSFDVIQSCSGKEWFILLVPAGAGKGSAALHVASRLGFPPEQIMVAGDGENDLPLFEITKLGARGVIVNNACARLKKWKEAEAPWTVVHAKESNAGGVLEGLWRHFRHFGYTHTAETHTPTATTHTPAASARPLSVEPVEPVAFAPTPVVAWTGGEEVEAEVCMSTPVIAGGVAQEVVQATEVEPEGERAAVAQRSAQSEVQESPQVQPSVTVRPEVGGAPGEQAGSTGGTGMLGGAFDSWMNFIDVVLWEGDAESKKMAQRELQSAEVGKKEAGQVEEVGKVEQPAYLRRLGNSLSQETLQVVQ